MAEGVLTNKFRYMSMPTRKPPLWRIAYSDVICLHIYNVYKDDN